ncbi:MAG: PEP-utilizing enzyme, partial [Candidatus Poseidoniia archaeon]
MRQSTRTSPSRPTVSFPTPSTDLDRLGEVGRWSWSAQRRGPPPAAAPDVLHGPHHKTVEPGYVLVADTTDPGWTPLFVNAAAIILQIGGVMQHGGVPPIV